jgi:hypothetical protein
MKVGKPSSKPATRGDMSVKGNPKGRAEPGGCNKLGGKTGNPSTAGGGSSAGEKYLAPRGGRKR